MKHQQAMPNLEDQNFKVSGDKAFYSLQGEGPTMGEPAVFLRLHYCNLHCVWCDTPYTWDKTMKEYFSEPVEWSVEETAKKVKKLWGCENPKKIKRLVITGGEPLLWMKQIEQLIILLPDWNVEIETNGTIMPSEFLLMICQFNCSPKLGNSKNDRKIRINIPVLKEIATRQSAFKFVVQKPEELDEIEKDFVIPANISVDKVILMPEGVSNKSLKEHSQAVAEYAKKKGYRIMGRLQINLWGKKRRK